MVDTQIRPSDVTKYPIIDAMLSVPREAYVPDDLREAAYLGENLDVGPGRVMLDPRTLAKMLDALDLQPDETVLDLGCAFGYSSALIARLVLGVVAVESDTAMAAEAQRILSGHDVDNAAVIDGPVAEGAAKHGPYDVIVLQGGAAAFPDTLAKQLKVGGRIACVFMEGALGVCRIGHRTEDGVVWRYAFNASAPIVEGFEAVAEFAL